MQSAQKDLIRQNPRTIAVVKRPAEITVGTVYHVYIMSRRGKNVAIGRKTPPQGEKSTGKRFEDGVGESSERRA